MNKNELIIRVYRVPSVTGRYSISYKMKCEYEKFQMYIS